MYAMHAEQPFQPFHVFLIADPSIYHKFNLSYNMDVQRVLLFLSTECEIVHLSYLLSHG